MVIRCEHCSTLYELDEALLEPEGSQVQCTKCQHVFVAYPPRAAGRTLVGMPVQPGSPAEPVRVAAAADRRDPPVARREPAGAHGHVPADGDHHAEHVPAHATPPPAQRVARAAPPPVYHPAGPPPPVRAPVLRRDTVGTFEARLRWMARWKWLGPTIAGSLLVLVIAGVVVLRRRADPGVDRARAEALALVALDDAKSLDDAVARLDEEARHAPRDRSVAADRALALVMRAAVALDAGESAAAQLAARSAERERLRREQPDGWEELERSAADAARSLENDVRERGEKARKLSRAALDSLQTLEREVGDRPEVLRGLATYYALGGERDRALRAVRAAREHGPADRWIDLAEAWLDARGPDRAGREHAVVKLAALASAHPALLRARYLLAHTQAALGRRGEALATLASLLAANPAHDGAKWLRADLTAPPPAPFAAGKPATPVAGKPATPARKPVAQPAAPVVRSPPSAAASGAGAGGTAVPHAASDPTRPSRAPASAPAMPPAMVPAAAPASQPPAEGGPAPAATARPPTDAPEPAARHPPPEPEPEPDQVNGG